VTNLLIESKCGYFEQLIGDSTSKVFTLHLPYGSTISLLLNDYEKFSLSSLINNICGIRPEYKSNEITFKFNDHQKLDDKVIVISCYN
jgi:hypothetical protein